MKGMVTIAALVGMALLGSCSWVKRFNRVRSTPPTEVQQVEPTPEQQEAALKLFNEEKENKEGENPEAAPEEMPEGASGDASELVPGEKPLKVRELQSGSRQQESEDGGDEGALPDPAQQRGLRSPSLPRLLPMDINGKINPGL